MAEEGNISTKEDKTMGGTHMKLIKTLIN